MRIVVKVGTSTLTYVSGQLNIRRTERLCKTLCDLKNAGNEIILVSSGAIAMGVGKLGLRERPASLPEKQAAAAVGQCELMYTYDRLFAEYRHTAAQLLLTGEDFNVPQRRTHLENTLFSLLRMGALPVVNENDTVSTAEISVGDNDTLAALVAVSAKADLLVLLSDIDGLYSADPHQHPEATLIHTVNEITPAIEALAGGAGSALGTGGMATKLHAAKIATQAGIDMVIAQGAQPELLYEIAAGQEVGTRFSAGSVNP